MRRAESGSKLSLPRALWLCALLVVVCAVIVQLVRTDGGIPVGLVVLTLLVIAIATPAASGVIDRIQEFSGGGFTVKLTATTESVEQRLQFPRDGEPEEDSGEGGAGHFIETVDERRLAHQLLELQGKLAERLEWVETKLDLPNAVLVDSVAKIERLRSSGLLLPDEADVLTSLASITPSQAEQEQRRNPEKLSAFVRTSDRLTYQLRSRIFTRQVRQVFTGPTLDDIWRIFDWEPQPSGRWTPWFIAHVDGRTKDAEMRSLLLAARTAPAQEGLRNAVGHLEAHRTEIPTWEGLQAFVVLRDGSQYLNRRAEFERPTVPLISFSELRGIAVTRKAPEWLSIRGR